MMFCRTLRSEFGKVDILINCARSSLTVEAIGAVTLEMNASSM